MHVCALYSWNSALKRKVASYLMELLGKEAVLHDNGKYKISEFPACCHCHLTSMNNSYCDSVQWICPDLSVGHIYHIIPSPQHTHFAIYLHHTLIHWYTDSFGGYWAPLNFFANQAHSRPGSSQQQTSRQPCCSIHQSWMEDTSGC